MLLFAEREPGKLDEIAGLPDLPLRGLPAGIARELLPRQPSAGHSMTACRIGSSPRRVATRWHCLSSRMNRPRRNWLAGSACRAVPLPGRIEESFLRRAQQLPAETQRLLLVAAAEPTGGGLCCGKRPGRWVSRPRPPGGQADGLLDLGPQVIFRHSLLRSAIYRAAAADERRRRIWRWPRPPMPRAIPTARPGTAPTRRSRLTRTSPMSWSARPGGPRRAAG